MTTSHNLTAQTIELPPSYTIPLVLVLIAIILLLLKPWVSLPIGLLGLFLMFQAVTIRLKFTPTALDIYSSERLIRTFPYADWQEARIFWNPVPILFYFKEVNSIHFLPVIFAPKILEECLDKYLLK